MALIDTHEQIQTQLKIHFGISRELLLGMRVVVHQAQVELELLTSFHLQRMLMQLMSEVCLFLEVLLKVRVLM
jgi:hypothetical protein